MITITSISNQRVKRVRALQAYRRDRWKEKCFVIEGTRLAHEALHAGRPIDLVLYTDRLKVKTPGLIHGLARLGGEVLSVSESVMAACSDTESPSGILVVVPFPELAMPERLTFALVIDRMADPGNLGALLRTSWALGVEAVFLTEGCVDPYNPKVVRAATGAHFHLPVFHISVSEIKDNLKEMALWVAESSAGMAYNEVDWCEPTALVIGSEAHGVGDELRALDHKLVHIPIRSEVESLNAAVAAGIILTEISRQRGAK
jgi:TrmH family RNA methyltransferase